MNTPIVSRPVANPPESAGTSNTTGEGAKSAFAAMIRKRQMGENRIEHEGPEQLARQAAPKE